MLLFSAVALLLALLMSFVRGQWAGALLWYALAVFFACYGLLFMDLAPRWHRPLLVLGFAAGILAFGSAVRLAGLW